MTKLDFKKELAQLYGITNRSWHHVDVPLLSFVAIDGVGDPNTSRSYAAAIEALYSVAYAVKFASKNELGRDYVVPPLEGLWRAEDYSVFENRHKDQFEWTMQIMKPAWIETELVERCIHQVVAKKNLPTAELLRIVSRIEGQSLQLLHIGSYDDEGPKLRELHQQVMPELGLEFNGDHHEIYLSDPRRTAAAKLRTILRQPVSPIES